MDLAGIIVAIILGTILLGIIVFLILEEVILPKVYKAEDDKYWASDKPDLRLKEFYNKYGWSGNVPRMRTWVEPPPRKNRDDSSCQ